MTAHRTENLDYSLDVSASHLVHSLMHFLRVIRFRKNIVFAACVAATLLGGLYYASVTRYYEAESRLLIRQTGPDALVPSSHAEFSKQDIIPTHCQLIKSAVVLQDAVQRLRPEYRVDLKGLPTEQWVNTLQRNLTATAVRRTHIVGIRYRSKHPVAAAAVVQAVTAAYFAFIDRTHKGTAGEILQVLSHEKVKLEHKLQEKETQLLEARRRFGDLGIKAGSEIVHPLVQRAIRFNEALVKAQEKRLELQSTLAAIQAAVRNGEDLQQHVLAVEGSVGREILLAGLGFGTRDADVQSKLERNLLEDQAEVKSMAGFFGPSHPRVQEIKERIQLTREYLTAYQGRMAAHISKLKNTRLGPMLIEMLSQELSKAWKQENVLNQSFEVARRDAVRLNGDLAQLDILEHDVHRLRSSHDALVNQIANTDIRQEHGDIRATVVKAPVAATGPVSPRLSVVLVFTVLGAALSGCVGVYVLDILDDRFRSPEEMQVRLGVPVLSIVRTLQQRQEQGLAGVQTHGSPSSVESEAFRTLRTAMSLRTEPTQRVVVSSSEPGDGKTTVLVNLGVSYAQSGRKTLLIDADLRRPGLSSLLVMKGKPGVADILRSSGDVDQMAARYVRTTEVAGLSVLSAGAHRSHPSELLAGPRLADLLAWAEGSYDQILVDSPPVLAASDTQIIGRLVDGAVLVVDSEKNRGRVVMRAIDSLKALDVRLLGVVANRLSLDDNADYGYGYGYGFDENETDPHCVEPPNGIHGAVGDDANGRLPGESLESRYAA